MLEPNEPASLCFNAFTLVLLLYIAIVTPYRIAFDVPPESDLIVGVEWFIDIYFIVDILVQFRTGYTSDTGNRILRPAMVARRYARGWFVIDILASIPFDRILSGMSGSKGTKVLKVGRLAKGFRVLRLAKLLRFVKVWKYITV